MKWLLAISAGALLLWAGGDAALGMVAPILFHSAPQAGAVHGDEPFMSHLAAGFVFARILTTWSMISWGLAILGCGCGLAAIASPGMPRSRAAARAIAFGLVALIALHGIGAWTIAATTAVAPRDEAAAVHPDPRFLVLHGRSTHLFEAEMLLALVLAMALIVSAHPTRGSRTVPSEPP